MTDTVSQLIPNHTPAAPTNTMTTGSKSQLLARARYNNVAESGDELSFRQGDIVTVVQKDFNNQVDWWLCELRGKRGMVPANYFEVFHEHDTAVYDIPRPSKKHQKNPSSATPSVTMTTATAASSTTTTTTTATTATTKAKTSTSSLTATSPQPSGTARPSSLEATDAPVYDYPPADSSATVPPEEDTDRDYDLPPPENNLNFDTYDRPPSSARLSPMGSTRSSVKSTNRISTTSSIASSNGIYDIPPDLLDVYDFPKSSQPARGFEEEGERERQANVLQAIDIGSMVEDEAEEVLRSHGQVISVTYEELFNSVYGAEAYWGSDNKAKRQSTLKATIAAVRHFDRALLSLLQFGKGVVNKLEQVSDMNFKRKYSNAFKGLLHNRNDILGKLEALNSEADSVTGNVKALLEIARTVPRSVTEFTILLQANKSILFLPSKPNSSLPVITKSEVKTRPLPELPHPHLPTATAPEIQEDDYAIPTEDRLEDSPQQQQQQQQNVLRKLSGEETNVTLNRKRKPNDTLPPLPFATLPRSLPQQKSRVPDPNISYALSSSGGSTAGLSAGGSGSGGNSPHHSRSNLHQQQAQQQIRTASPVMARQEAARTLVAATATTGEDYDEIDPTRERSVVLTSRPSLHSLGSNSSRGASPTHHLRIRRQGSLSSCSSSDDLNNSSGSGMRRANSVELLDSPYGRPQNNHHHHPHHHHQRQLSGSPQPLKMEEKLILERFAKQFDLIIPGLRDAIDLLLNCLKDNEPPKDFVTKSKLTVVAAYKLVYVADALSQKIVHNETKSALMCSSNNLTESIKELVSGTKTAALQYPSVIALDKMGESVKQLYPTALDLINSVKARASLV